MSLESPVCLMLFVILNFPLEFWYEACSWPQSSWMTQGRQAGRRQMGRYSHSLYYLQMFTIISDCRCCRCCKPAGPLSLLYGETFESSNTSSRLTPRGGNKEILWIFKNIFHYNNTLHRPSGKFRLQLNQKKLI